MVKVGTVPCYLVQIMHDLLRSRDGTMTLYILYISFAGRMTGFPIIYKLVSVRP